MLGFDVALEDDGPSQVKVVVTGDLDISTAPQLSDAVRSALNVRNAKKIMLDLRPTTFLDSSGVTALVNLKRDASERGVSVILLGTSSYVDRVLGIVGLTDLFA